MLRITKRKFFVFYILFVLGLFLFVIPSRLPTVYLSPDETAVAVAAREFGTRASLRLADKMTETWPWLHPRSWVTNQGTLVPVGFLGLPLLAGIVWRLFGEIGLLVMTPLLVLSAAVPLWRFLKSLGWYAQISGIAVWLSFPTVILYANRGLFPNLALVCLMLWSAYLVWDKPGPGRWLTAGFLFGLAAAVRPTELLWMVVWIAAAWLAGKEAKAKFPPRRGLALFFAGAAVFPALAAFMAWKTYGTPFIIGYWLHDPAVNLSGSSGPRPAASSPGWPFGFHPRNVWFNLQGYVFGLLAPWVVISLAAAVFWLRAKQKSLPIAVGTITAVLLVLVYGQAIYQDHVGRDVVSIGNSFLRYLLPVTPFAAAAAAALVGLVARSTTPRRAKVFTLLFIGGLAAAGIWNAINHDDEALRQGVGELDRYEMIRRAVFNKYGRHAIVVSDRSDKIFFPVTRVVSPLPDDAKLADLVANSPDPVLIFDTAYDSDRMGDWLSRGFILNPILETKNQRLYEVSLTSSDAFGPNSVWPSQ